MPGGIGYGAHVRAAYSVLPLALPKHTRDDGGMVTRSGKRSAWAAGLVGVLVLAGASVVCVPAILKAMRERELLQQLGSHSPAQVQSAIEELGELRSLKAFLPLLRLETSPLYDQMRKDRRVVDMFRRFSFARDQAVERIHEGSPNSCRRLLLRALEDEDESPRLRALACSWLIRWGEDKDAVLPTLHGLLRDEEAGLREWAAAMVREMQVAEYRKGATDPAIGQDQVSLESLSEDEKAQLYAVAVHNLVELVLTSEYQMAGLNEKLQAPPTIPAGGYLLEESLVRRRLAALSRLRTSFAVLQPEPDHAIVMAGSAPEEGGVIPWWERPELWLDGYDARELFDFVASRVELLGGAAVPALCGKLQQDDPRTRETAARLLGVLGSEGVSAWGALVAVLDDPSSPVSDAASHALGKVGSGAKTEVAGLTVLLESTNANALRGAIVALSYFGDQGDAVDRAILSAMQHPDPSVQAEAIVALSGVSGELLAPYISRVTELLAQTASSEVRKAAAEALDTMGQAVGGAVPLLASLLRSDDPGDAVNAATALGTLGSTAIGAVPALRKLAEGDPEANQGLRQAAADALKRILSPGTEDGGE